MPRQNCNSMAVFAVTVYSVFTSIDYGIPDAVGKRDAVTPFVHKVWQDYRW